RRLPRHHAHRILAQRPQPLRDRTRRQRQVRPGVPVRHRKHVDAVQLRPPLLHVVAGGHERPAQPLSVEVAHSHRVAQCTARFRRVLDVPASSWAGARARARRRCLTLPPQSWPCVTDGSSATTPVTGGIETRRARPWPWLLVLPPTPAVLTSIYNSTSLVERRQNAGARREERWTCSRARSTC